MPLVCSLLSKVVCITNGKLVSLLYECMSAVKILAVLAVSYSWLIAE